MFDAVPKGSKRYPHRTLGRPVPKALPPWKGGSNGVAVRAHWGTSNSLKPSKYGHNGYAQHQHQHQQHQQHGSILSPATGYTFSDSMALLSSMSPHPESFSSSPAQQAAAAAALTRSASSPSNLVALINAQQQLDQILQRASTASLTPTHAALPQNRDNTRPSSRAVGYHTRPLSRPASHAGSRAPSRGSAYAGSRRPGSRSSGRGAASRSQFRLAAEQSPLEGMYHAFASCASSFAGTPLARAGAGLGGDKAAIAAAAAAVGVDSEGHKWLKTTLNKSRVGTVPGLVLHGGRTMPLCGDGVAQRRGRPFVFGPVHPAIDVDSIMAATQQAAPEAARLRPGSPARFPSGGMAAAGGGGQVAEAPNAAGDGDSAGHETQEQEQEQEQGEEQTHHQHQQGSPDSMEWARGVDGMPHRLQSRPPSRSRTASRARSRRRSPPRGAMPPPLPLHQGTPRRQQQQQNEDYLASPALYTPLRTAASSAGLSPATFQALGQATGAGVSSPTFMLKNVTSVGAADYVVNTDLTWDVGPVYPPPPQSAIKLKAGGKLATAAAAAGGGAGADRRHGHPLPPLETMPRDPGGERSTSPPRFSPRQHVWRSPGFIMHYERTVGPTPKKAATATATATATTTTTANDVTPAGLLVQTRQRSGSRLSRRRGSAASDDVARPATGRSSVDFGWRRDMMRDLQTPSPHVVLQMDALLAGSDRIRVRYGSSSRGNSPLNRQGPSAMRGVYSGGGGGGGGGGDSVTDASGDKVLVPRRPSTQRAAARARAAALAAEDEARAERMQHAVEEMGDTGPWGMDNNNIGHKPTVGMALHDSHADVLAFAKAAHSSPRHSRRRSMGSMTSRSRGSVVSR